MAPGWSATETKALLCAWHEEAALPAPVLRSTSRSSDQLSEMYMRFVALCGGHTLRTQVSMYMRRNTLKNMWRIITKYNSQHKHEGDNNDSSGNGTRNSSTGWRTQGWFVLQEWEKQVWFTKADVKSYKLVDIDQHTFHAIDGIMTIAAHQKEKERERRLQCQQQVEGASSLSVASQEAAEGEEATEEQHDKMPEHLPDDSVDFDSDSRSSTESDEEVIAVASGVTSEALTVPADFVPLPNRKKNREPEIAQNTDDGWHPIITKKQKLSRPIHAAQKPISSPPELNQSPAQRQRMPRSKLVFLDEPSPLVQTPAVNAAKSSTSGGTTVSSGIASNAHHATEQQPKPAVTQSKGDQRPTSDAGPTQLVQALNERKSDTTGTQSRSHMFNRPRSQKESVCPVSDQQERPKTTLSAITWDALTFGSIQSTTSHAQRVRKRWKQWDDPDRPELLDRLQKRIDKLKSIFRDVSAYQKVAQDERNELLEQIRLDKEEKRLALEEIRCREVNIQQELNEWRLEKEEFKREWRLKTSDLWEMARTHRVNPSVPTKTAKERKGAKETAFRKQLDMARKWSYEETSALVRAYKDALENEPRNASRAMFERFCAFYDGNTVRTEASMRLRKDQLANMVEVAFAYYEIRREGKDGVLGDHDGSTNSSSSRTASSNSRGEGVDEVIRVWWSLTEQAQKTWHSKLNTKSYPFVEIEEDHFRTIASITRHRSASSHQGHKFPIKANFADCVHEALARRATELPEDHKLSLKECIQANSSALGDDSKDINDDGASNHSGSSTESDDAILECWDEIVPRSPVRDLRSSDENAQQCNDANDNQKEDKEANARSSWQSWIKGDDQKSAIGCDQMAAPYPRKRKRQVDPEIMGLVDILERQARLLGDMFHQAKEARKQEQQERRHVLEQIEQEKIARSKVLECVMRSEDATRRARDEWKRERDEMKREWAAMQEQERRR